MNFEKIPQVQGEKRENKGKVILPTPEEIRDQVEFELDKEAREQWEAEEFKSEDEDLQKKIDQILSGNIEQAVTEVPDKATEERGYPEQLQEAVRQTGIEQAELQGFLSGFSKKTRKAIAVAFAGVSLWMASGAFSKAEAGDSFFHKAAKQVETGVLGQIRGGFDRGERTADDRQRMQSYLEQRQVDLAVQDQYTARQMALDKIRRAEDRQYQKELRAEQKQERREEMKLRAIEREARRYEKAIARSNERTFANEENKHNEIMRAIEKSYPSSLESQKGTSEQQEEASYGQVRNAKGDAGSRSFGPADREGL